MTPTISSALRALLDDGARFDAEYGRALSNHLPMALVALARLGAGDEQLRAYADRYAQAKVLRPARTQPGWPTGEAWTAYLGRPEAWPMYRSLFRQWMGHEGAADMLSQVLPALLPGCGAAAFHGLIRTAYGIQAEHGGEIADGLAHWAASHLPLGELPAARAATADPATLLRRLRAGTSRAGLIVERMADAARGGAVNRVVAALAIDDATPGRLARAAALAYAESGNFTALHLVTGTHAMRIVAPFVEDGAAAWRAFWQAYAHGVVAAGLRVAPPVPLRGWGEIVGCALASPDEHVIKLVDSAREEEAAYGGDDWRRAASRAVAREASAATASAAPARGRNRPPDGARAVLVPRRPQRS